MNNIVACIDATPVSLAVCDCAAWAAMRMDAPLEFLHVLQKPRASQSSDLSGNIGLGARSELLKELADLDEQRARLAMQQGEALLQDAQQRAIRDGVKNPISSQRHGGLVEALTTIEERIRVLVMGKHEEKLSEHVGSRLENVVRTMNKPILIATSKFRAPERVMIAFDGSKTTRKMVELVARSPLFKGLACHLLMVGEDNADHQRQLEWAQSQLEIGGFTVTPAIIAGEVESVLCDYRAAHNIDMLIMGAYGHSAIRRFLVGSTTTSLIRSATVPVLLMR